MADFYDTAARDAFINELKRVARDAMKPEMSSDEIEEIHLDAVEWLTTCLMMFGTSEMKVRRAVHRGAVSARKVADMAQPKGRLS